MKAGHFVLAIVDVDSIVIIHSSRFGGVAQESRVTSEQLRDTGGVSTGIQ